MKFKDAEIGAKLRFVECSTNVYEKFEESYVSGVERGQVKRYFIRPDIQVFEVEDD